MRVLVANETRQRVEEVAETIIRLGHDAIATVTDLGTIAGITVAEQPDVAVIIAGSDTEHALAMIAKVVHEAVCPVILLVDFEDPVFIREAARLGVFAYISQEDFADLQSSIDIVLCRFAEYRNLEGAFVRRALTERAKGVLMERHGVTHDASSAMLDARAQASGRRVVEIAEAILVSCNILSSGSPR